MLSSIDSCHRYEILGPKNKNLISRKFRKKPLADFSKQMKIYENAAFCEFAFFVRRRTKLFTFGRKSN